MPKKSKSTESTKTNHRPLLGTVGIIGSALLLEGEQRSFTGLGNTAREAGSLKGAGAVLMDNVAVAVTRPGVAFKVAIPAIVGIAGPPLVDAIMPHISAKIKRRASRTLHPHG